MKDYKLKIHGQEFNVRVENINDASTEATVNVNGVEYLVEIEGAKPVKVSKPQVTRIPENAPNNPTPATAAPSKPAAVSASGTKIACPLPGTVLSIKVKVGDTVKKGDVIAKPAAGLSLPQHASIDGTVTFADAGKIIITK